MSDAITSFNGDNFFLSNFYVTPVFYQGIRFESSEAAFQAAKCPERMQEFCGLNPSEAKRLGRSVTLRPDWEEVKLDVMYQVCMAKFTQNPRLAEKLIATGDAELVEGNTWGDRICQACGKRLENQLVGNGILERSTTVSNEDMVTISALERRELDADDVYTFCIKMCDNEIDRDFERFSTETLTTLADMFVGKTGFLGMQQTAKIYKAEVVTAGECYCWIKGYAYIIRDEKTNDLISEIKVGLKKEISIGCAVNKVVYSVCGEDVVDGHCDHAKGEVYDGQVCHHVLQEPTDVYEWSFVVKPTSGS